MIKVLLTLILVVIVVLGGFFIFNTFQGDEPSITGRVTHNYVENTVDEKNKVFLEEEIKELEEGIEEYKETIKEEISASEEAEEKKISHEYKTFSVIEGEGDLNPVMLLYDIEPSQIAEQDSTIIKVRPGVDDYEELYGYIKNSEITTIITQETWRINEMTNLRRATGVSLMIKFAKEGQNGGVEPLTFNSP